MHSKTNDLRTNDSYEQVHLSKSNAYSATSVISFMNKLLFWASSFSESKTHFFLRLFIK